MEKMRGDKRSRPTIGVLAGWQTYPGTIHTFLDHVFRGMQTAARDFDCNLLIGCAVNSPFYQHASQVMPILLPGADFIPVGPWNTDGMLVAGPLFNDSAERYFQDLIDSGFPLVYAGDREVSPTVNVDNEGGIRLAVDHLVEHGHRRIAYLAGYTVPRGDSAARWRGYREGLNRHGLAYDPDLVGVGEHLTEASYHAMRKMIETGKPFSAVIASNDEAAVGVIQALGDFDLLVPRDVAVIGFDDRLEARAQIPVLTTVHHPMFELGYQSLELVLRMIRGEAPLDSLLRIPTHLVIRESCGCLPGRQPGLAGLPKEVAGLAPPVFQPYLHGAFRPGAASGQPGQDRFAPEVAHQMAELVHREMQRMGRSEVEELCQWLLESYVLSLEKGDGSAFQRTMQQILQHTAALDGDLFAWHSSVTLLQKWTPAILQAYAITNSPTLSENLLHQARIAISEIQRGQYARLVMREAAVANMINHMSARFFSAKEEADIFHILRDSAGPLNIQQAAVFYYHPEGQDPFAFSEMKTPALADRSSQIFFTRDFPPPRLYAPDLPFQAALLPLFIPDGPSGYAAFQTGDLAPLGQIVRQLVAALHNVYLYQKTVEARELAEEANEQKSRFLSVVSHELRTPLSLIFGLSNMMLEESRAAGDQELLVSARDLKRVYIGAQHLESLIRDVLDLARSDVGQLRLHLEPINLREVLEAVAAIGEQLAHDKDLSWEMSIPDDLPLVRADRTRLRQVVLNLVNNAVKFTVRGGITLSACVVDGTVRVSVRDTGLGIPREDQCVIFDEYRQSRRTTARGYGGLGLGLAICKRLIEMQGGEIGVTSSGEEGEGSLFFFSMPSLERQETPQPKPAPDQVAQRVLILVKDLAGSVHIVNHLAGKGFQVTLHPVAQDGDWMPCLHETPPDRVMLDLALTSERGWEILKTLKENPTTRDLPLLFFDLQNEQDQGAMLDLNFMTKPLSSAELAEELTGRGLSLAGGSCGPSRPILIVDDDPEVLDLHTRIVETVAGGYTVLCARNGREALEIIRQARPTLVLLDLMMPEVDGFEVLEAMRAEDLLHNTQVVVLTGQALTEEDMARLNCGVASVLGKGMFTAQETLAHIADALDRRRRSGTESHRMALKAIAFLHAHYKEPLSRADVASYVGVSERHLSRCFQQEIGLSPMTYLNRLRVKMAKTLLDARQHSITDIAIEVGFSTGGYFSRVFREEEGLSPREYLQTRNGK
jgi:signal transduction histidine kinase/DNA-binding LacI/PurR family transcriptional regulator/DNA-binding response OmpR family regulator